MNIGVDIRSLMYEKRTGVGEYTYKLLNAIFSIDYTDDKKDYTDMNQYFLFYNSYQDVSQNIPQWQQSNVHYVVKRWPNKLFNLFLTLKLIKLDKLVPSKLDLWFSPNIHYTNLSKNLKQILTIHDLSFEILPECFPRKWQWAYKVLRPKKQCQRANVILTPSENTKRDVEEVYKVKSEKVKVLYSGLCIDFGFPARFANESVAGRQTSDSRLIIKEKYNLPDKYILYLGTLEPRKNIEAVIEAYRQLGTLNTDHYSLIIAGAKGWKYEKIMQKIEATEGVQYIGYVAAEDKAGLYQAATIFVYSSLYEGFGFPVLEAMAQGTPVITSSRSSLPEVVAKSAYLVNPNNIAEIRQGMKNILSDNKLHDILVKRGKEQAQKFNWQKTAQDFLNVLT